MTSTIKLSQVGPDGLQVLPDYAIRVAQVPYLRLCVNTLFGKTIGRYDHPHVAVKQNEIYEFKHYAKHRGKFWTQKAGLTFSFMFAREAIELVPENHWTFPEVLLGGRQFTLSCSGDYGGDALGKVVDICVKPTLAVLRHLSQHATAPAVVRQTYPVDIHELRKDRQERFTQLVAKHQVQQLAQPGWKICTVVDFTAGGSTRSARSRGPFPLIERPRGKQHFRVAGNPHFGWARVTYDKVDWLKTAELNGVELIAPSQINRLGVVLPNQET